MTPRKLKLKRRLKWVLGLSEKLRKKYQRQKKKMKMKTSTRVVHQTLKRKIAIIERKKTVIHELRSGAANADVVKTTESLKLKEAHRKLLHYHRMNKKTAVPFSVFKKLEEKNKDKDATISDLEHRLLLLGERVEELSGSAPCTSMGLKENLKTYSGNTRMRVFDHIVNKVPTANIPVLLRQNLLRSSAATEERDVPQRSTVELMARELGAISELQVAEVLIANQHVTVGFDATTQEGTHVNEIHFTTGNECLSAAVDELAGRTAVDYSRHICETVDSLAHTFVHFHEDSTFPDTRMKLIYSVTNSMSDRCATNHATIRLVNTQWGKTLNEMNCHLHPLDSFTTSCRSALKSLEDTTGNVFGRDCLAANFVLGMNKLRYKDGKGDPRGFVTFLDRCNLPRGILPRYRGNRLHILFHNAGVLIEHQDTFAKLLKVGTTLGGLRSSLEKDFRNEDTLCELQVLGLLGKHLTGPWMTKFYTAADTEISHVDGINIVKELVETLKQMMQNSPMIIPLTKDFFGQDLALNSAVKLKALPSYPRFSAMMKSCLQAVVDVLQRQYAKYFTLDIDEKLREETASVRLHNIDSEEIMGMFSEAQKKAPNATLCFLSARMRSCKNKTVEYLDAMSEERRDYILIKAIKLGRMQRDRRRKSQKELQTELVARQKTKEQKRNETERKAIERYVKQHGLEATQKTYPDLDYSRSDRAVDLLEGKVVGKRMCHVWLLDGELVTYNGLVQKLYATKKYRISYWTEEEELDDASDYQISMYALVVDLLHQDLMFAD